MIPTQRRVYLSPSPTQSNKGVYERKLSNVIPNPTSAIPGYLNIPNKVVNVKKNSRLIFNIYVTDDFTIGGKPDAPMKTKGTGTVFPDMVYVVGDDVMITRENSTDALGRLFIDKLHNFLKTYFFACGLMYTTFEEGPIVFEISPYGKFTARKGTLCTDAFWDKLFTSSVTTGWETLVSAAQLGYVGGIKFVFTALGTPAHPSDLWSLLFGPPDIDPTLGSFVYKKSYYNYLAVDRTLVSRLTHFSNSWTFDPYWLLREIYVVSNFTNNIYQIDYPLDNTDSVSKHVWTHLWGVIPFDVDENSKNLSLNFTGEQLVNSFNVNCYQNIQLTDLKIEFYKKTPENSFIYYPFVTNEVSLSVDFR